MEGGAKIKESLKAAGKKRLEEFRLKRQHKNEGSQRHQTHHQDVGDPLVQDKNQALHKDLDIKGQINELEQINDQRSSLVQGKASSQEQNDANLKSDVSVPHLSEADVDDHSLVDERAREQQQIRELEDGSSAMTELEQFISQLLRAPDEPPSHQQELMAKRVSTIILKVKRVVEEREEEEMQLKIGIQAKVEEVTALKRQMTRCMDRLHVVDAGLSDRDEELRRLQEENAEIAVVTAAEKEQLQTRLESVTQRLGAALETNSVLHSRNLGLERELQQASSDRANFQVLVDKQREEFNCLENHLKEQGQAAHLEKISLVEQNQRSVDNEIAGLKERNADLIEKMEGLEKTAAAEKVLLEEAFLQLNQQLDEARRDLEQASSGLGASTAVIAKQQAEIERIEDLLKEQELTLAENKLGLSDRDEEICRLEKGNAELHSKLVELEFLQTGLRHQLEETMNDRALLEKQLRTSKAVVEEQVERMHDLRRQNSNLKRVEAPILEALDKLEQNTTSRLVRLSSKLEALESVNLMTNEQAGAKILDFEVSIHTLIEQILQLEPYLTNSTSDAARYISIEQELEIMRRRLAESEENKQITAAEQEMRIRDLLNRVAVMQENVAQANLHREQLQAELDVVNHRLHELMTGYGKGLGDCDSELSLLEALKTTGEDNVEHTGLGILGKVDYIARLLMRSQEKTLSSEREVEQLSGKLRCLTEETGLLEAALSDALQSKNDLLGRLENVAAEQDTLEKRFAEERSKLQDRALLLNEYEAKLHRICSSTPSQWTDDFKDEADVIRRLELSFDATISGFRASLEELELKTKQLEDDKQQLQDKLMNKTTELDVLSRKWNAEGAQLKNGLNTCRTERDNVSAERDRLRLDLSDSEQRLAAVREKLGLAVKKGKNLAQQRDELKLLLEQKSTEIDTLNVSWKTKLDAEVQKLSLEKDGIVRELKSIQSAARVTEEQLAMVKTALENSKIKEESLATELAVQNRKYADVLKQNEDHVREARSLDAEISRMTEELDESSSKHKSMESVLAAQRRKYADVLEEKQLLEASKREAWLKVQELMDQVGLLQSEVYSQSEAMDVLKRSIQALEKEKSSVQLELATVESELSEGFGKKMQVLAEVDGVAVGLLQLLFPSDELNSLPELSRGPSEKAVVFEAPFLLEKERLQHAAVFERISLTKSTLGEIVARLSSFQKLAKYGFPNLVQGLEINERELAACQTQLASKERELMALDQENERLSSRLEELEDILDQNHSAMGSMETSRNKAVGKLTFTLSKLHELQQQCESMVTEMERRQVDLDNCLVEISQLNRTVDALRTEMEDRSASLSQLLMKLRALIAKTGGRATQGDLVEVLDTEIERLLRELKCHEATLERKDFEIQNLRRQMDEFTAERLRPLTSTEIEEVEQPKHVTVVASAPHIRNQKKDQLVIDVGAELLNAEEKGNAFKSMATLRIFSKSGHYLGDHIDVLCVSVGKLLMRQPVARLSLIVYWIAIHFWIAATITIAKL